MAERLGLREPGQGERLALEAAQAVVRKGNVGQIDARYAAAPDLEDQLFFMIQSPIARDRARDVRGRRIISSGLSALPVQHASTSSRALPKASISESVVSSVEAMIRWFARPASCG